MRMIRVLLALLLGITPVYAQGVGQLGSGQLWGNSTASRAPAAPTTVTAIVDRAISSTDGAILTRNASAWIGLAPGTVGQVLGMGAARPSWSTVTALMDSGICSTRGNIIYRAASVWSCLANGAAGQILQSSGVGADPAWATAPSSGIDANVLNVQSGNYTILNTDCGKTISLTGALTTTTLPAVGGFSGTCVVRVTNASATRAQKLTGFPVNAMTSLACGSSNSCLWPRQTVEVKIVNGAWIATLAPGRWRWDQQYDLYVATTGSDNNDCLATGTAGCLTIQKAVDIGCNAFDTNGFSPRINVADGTYKGFQLISDCLGGNVVNVIGNIAAPQNVILNTGGAGGAVIYAKDKGFILISGVKLVGDVAASIGLDCGQSAVIDAGIINFGAFSGNGLHIRSADFCRINQTGNWFVTGSALAFIYASNVSVVAMQGGGSIDIAAALTFSYLLLSERNSGVIGGSTFVGSTPTTTINTCLAQMNGVIQKVGSTIPGTQACDQATSTATGGQVQ